MHQIELFDIQQARHNLQAANVEPLPQGYVLHIDPSGYRLPSIPAGFSEDYERIIDLWEELHKNPVVELKIAGCVINFVGSIRPCLEGLLKGNRILYTLYPDDVQEKISKALDRTPRLV